MKLIKRHSIVKIDNLFLPSNVESVVTILLSVYMNMTLRIKQ